MAKTNSPSSSGKSSKGSRQTPPSAPETWRQRIASVFNTEGDAGKGKKRRISRKERDDKRTKYLYITLSVIGVSAILMISGVAIYEYYLKPNKALATVEGEEITRRDYWKYQSHSLISQTLQYQQYAQLMQGEQQQQYLAMAQQAQAQLADVWGSTSVDDAALSRMIDDKVIVQNLDSLGLSISDEEVENFVANQFADPSAPISSPTPTQTLIPERAEWATQTAVAVEPVASPLASEGSPAPASPEAVASPAPGTPKADGSPVAVASPGDEATPLPTPTVGPEGARATSEANLGNYEDDVLSEAHMSVADYERLVAEPALAREKVNAYFADELGQSAEQVHAAHILVGTKELADELYSQLQADPDQFSTLASEASVDTSTAPNGGDLGWFPRGIMVEPFEEVAFNLPEGDISEPFQTEFGWHILNVLEHENDRALTDSQITQASQSLAERWLSEQTAAADVSSSIEPTPTQSIAQFVPPADAPPLPTPVPEATPATSPVALPESSPAAPASGSPEAVQEASPAATPSLPAGGSPEPAQVASPVESPIASPVASPWASPIVGAD